MDSCGRVDHAWRLLIVGRPKIVSRPEVNSRTTVGGTRGSAVPPRSMTIVEVDRRSSMRVNVLARIGSLHQALEPRGASGQVDTSDRVVPSATR